MVLVGALDGATCAQVLSMVIIVLSSSIFCSIESKRAVAVLVWSVSSVFSIGLPVVLCWMRCIISSRRVTISVLTAFVIVPPSWIVVIVVLALLKMPSWDVGSGVRPDDLGIAGAVVLGVLLT